MWREVVGWEESDQGKALVCQELTEEGEMAVTCAGEGCRKYKCQSELMSQWGLQGRGDGGTEDAPAVSLDLRC